MDNQRINIFEKNRNHSGHFAPFKDAKKENSEDYI